MRLCVRWLSVCAGEEKRSLRKSAFWARALTEKRTLHPPPHGKAHSGGGPSRKGALCATARMQTALFREVAGAECALWSRRGGVAGAECVFM